jgi:hypothetical protein
MEMRRCGSKIDSWPAQNQVLASPKCKIQTWPNRWKAMTTSH